MRDASRTDRFGAGSHLSSDLLIRAIDDELSGAETVSVESHLAQCEGCRQKHQELRVASLKFEGMIAGVAVQLPGGRDQLIDQLEKCEHERLSRTPRDVARRFGWGMAIAATLAIGVLFIPKRENSVKSGSANIVESQAAFEVDGESFVALPYSNPALPMNSSHIVQMQVPVSSLTDAGIVFEPIANEVLRPDDSVLADVLLGMDGQPLGVHVLGMQ